MRVREVVGVSQLAQVLLNARPPCSADGLTTDGLVSSSASLVHFLGFAARLPLIVPKFASTVVPVKLIIVKSGTTPPPRLPGWLSTSAVLFGQLLDWQPIVTYKLPPVDKSFTWNWYWLVERLTVMEALIASPGFTPL